MVLMKKKWGGNSRKRFHSEMCGNAVLGGAELMKILWDSPRMAVLWNLLNTFG